MTTGCFYYTAPPGRYEAGQAYLAAQRRVFVVRYGYGEAANWQHLEEAARQVISSYKYASYGSELSPCPAAPAAQVVR